MSSKKDEKHVDSSFDTFLEEEGLLDQAEAIAAKRVFVFQLEKELKKQKIKKDDLAYLMGTSRSSVRRLLDPESPSTLRTLSSAALAVGKHIKVILA
ncbi:MAG: XRE family transcriptional regulator [Chlamydiia bacterium]|nr:XRE family transcriptional regulator [Chlamydiia bacterium]